MVTTFSHYLYRRTKAIALIAKRRPTKNSIRRIRRRSCFSRRATIRAFHIGDPPLVCVNSTSRRPSFSIYSPGNTVVGFVIFNHPRDEGKRQTTSLFFLFFFFSFRRVVQFFLSAWSLAEVRSPRIARPRKPAAIVYRVTVSRDYGSLRILRECRIGAASIFVRPARFVNFSRLLRNFYKTHTDAGASEKNTSERVIRVSTYHSHLSRDGVKTELPMHRIYFRKSDRERTYFSNARTR